MTDASWRLFFRVLAEFAGDLELSFQEKAVLLKIKSETYHGSDDLEVLASFVDEIREIENRIGG